MIDLVVTANDALYQRLVTRLDQPVRATNALDGFKLASRAQVDRVIVDLNLYAADTLIETLRSRPETAHLAVHAVKESGTIPLSLRQLCERVWEAHDL